MNLNDSPAMDPLQHLHSNRDREKPKQLSQRHHGQNDVIGSADCLSFLQKTLVGRPFIGMYTERSLVREQGMKFYREVIVIDDAETRLKTELRVALEMMRRYPRHFRWPAITVCESDESVRLWVKFPYDVPQTIFGPAKWTLTTVEWTAGAIEMTAERKELSAHFPRFNLNNMIMFDSVSWAGFWTGSKEIARIVALFFIVVVDVLFRIIDLAHKVLDILPKTINALMPLFLAIIDAVTKCIGGLYILIAMMWNGTAVNRPRAPFPGIGMTGSDRAIAYKRQPYQPRRTY